MLENNRNSDKNSMNVESSEYVPFWSIHSTRFWIAFILMFLVFCALNMKSNIGIAMVCMINSTAYTTTTYDNGSIVKLATKNPACIKSQNPGEIEDLGYHGTYLWNPEMQGALISSTAYGSIITIIFAGYIADAYGPRFVCLWALVLYTVVTLLSPMLADWNYVVFLIARAIMGLAEGCIFPCVAALIVKWFPKTERSTVAAIYTSGNQFGAGVGTYVSAKLCLLSFFGGWPLIFYIYGILSIICIILWYFFATNNPDDCKFINEKEASYLKKAIGTVNQEENIKEKRLDVPWRQVFLSPVTWAVIINRFCYIWKITVMQMLLPSYFRDVLYLNMEDNGLYTALPFIAQLISKNIFAIVADNLRRSGKVGMTASTKIMEGFASFGCAICLILLIILVDCTTPPIITLTILLLFGIFAGGMVAGAFTASLCIAPDFSGIIESATGFMAILSQILAPMLAGFITQTGSRNEWGIVFGITGVLLLFSGIFFLIFGSADVQPWSKFYHDNKNLTKIQPSDLNEPKKMQEYNERIVESSA